MNPPPPTPKWPLVIALVGSAVLLATAVAAAVVYGPGFVSRFDERLPATDADRAVLITAEDVAAHMKDYQPDPRYESVHRQRSRLLPHDAIAYAYKDPHGIDVFCTVNVLSNELDAREVFQRTGLKLKTSAASSKGLELVDRDAYAWGDESRSIVFVENGKPTGDAYWARDGRRVFYFATAKVHFKDLEVFNGMLKEKLERFAEFEP